LSFRTWTNLEYLKGNETDVKEKKYSFIYGDGCNMPFKDKSFDTILNIQVLEHVLNPIKMVDEISRVMRPNGYGIFLIPHTAVMHMAPYHYYNFTRFWIREVMKRASLKIIELRPLGGTWSSMASHLFYFFLQSTRFQGNSVMECKRNVFFYLLFPLMVLYAVISIPICMFLSLGDLEEEPNNYLVIVIKQ
jgi:ubiquinone/menaquinone biosynthesis C-methylase UbiE